MKKKIPGNDANGLDTGKKRILIADDDDGIQDIFRIIFEEAGYIVDIKQNGEDLLKNKFTTPHLFLIDKQLSGYNGLDICRYLKSRAPTQSIPLIMISASPDIVKLAKEAGADDCVKKPFDIDQLLKVVDAYIAT